MQEIISIIVPVYNAEDTLDRCVKSLMSQTYKNIEIILVNDGSKDASLDICKKYEKEDSRIIVINKDNGGVSSARNAGIDIASGKFIMFCDSDDWAEPNWCEELITNYEPECLVMCGFYIEGNQNVVPYKICSKTPNERYSRNSFYQLKLSFFNSPWSKIYLKSRLNKNGIRFDINFTNGEDFLFNLKYLNVISGEIIHLDKCLYHYNWPEKDCSLSSQIKYDHFEKCRDLYIAVGNEIKRLGGINEKDMYIYYTDFFNQYQRGLDYLLKSNLSLNSKCKIANSVMRSREYRECVKHAKISSNKIFSILWKIPMCYGLWLWYAIRG